VWRVARALPLSVRERGGEDEVCGGMVEGQTARKSVSAGLRWVARSENRPKHESHYTHTHTHTHTGIHATHTHSRTQTRLDDFKGHVANSHLR
jgi:hypothetical protein